jgi:hypothetical protein
MKANMARYQIAETAIKKGKTGVAVVALSPEIGEGVGCVLAIIITIEVDLSK